MASFSFNRRIVTITSIFYCLLLVIPGFSQQQQPSPYSGFGIETNVSAGKILRHTANFKTPVPDVSTAYEVNFLQQTYGKQDWEQRRNYPLFGFGFSYVHYGSDSILGNCISIYPNIQLPIIRGKKLEWTFRAGFGLGYMTKRFERFPSWDTANNLIGSHVNNYSSFSTDLRYHLNKHLDIQAGLNFSHASNAALMQPNRGINMYGAHVGLRYFPVNSNPEKIHKQLQPLSHRYLVHLRLGIAFNQAGEADGPLYPVYLASGFVSRRWNSVNKLFAGIDYSYHTNIYAFLRNNEILPGQERNNSWKSAVFVGNEFMLGRVGILFQVGYYLHNAYIHLDPYYEKLGGNVYFLQKEKGPIKEASVGVFLKAHGAQAELAELGLGFGF